MRPRHSQLLIYQDGNASLELDICILAGASSTVGIGLHCPLSAHTLLSHNLNITSHSFSPHVEPYILSLCLALLFLLGRDQNSNSPGLPVGAGHASSLFTSNSLDCHKRANRYLLRYLTLGSKRSRQPQ